MSKFNKPQRDAGMTLPEILIAVVLTGLLVTSLSMSVTVILKQSDNTEGRVNNARSEQNVNLWMPTDLASSEIVSTSAGASPCAPTCPAGADVGGTNALMLTWRGTEPGPGGVAVPTETKASYRYVQVGTEYQMIRVACVSVNAGAPSCRVNVVLHALDPPPAGVPYIPGSTPPTWVMRVSQALDPADHTDLVPTDPTFKNKNGQRVIVTINGGGDSAGAGGGQNQISLSAGGTERTAALATNSVSFNQTLTAARTRCGGNFGMVIDYSGSINRAPNPSTTMDTVRTAITAMIDTFAGTPVKLELSKFGWLGAVLGGDATGSRYFDMLNETDVSDLKIYVNGGTTSTGVVTTKIDSVNDATNWEDGLYRMFRNTDGTIQARLPQKVIFFTDGIPSYDRLGGVAGQPGTSAAPAATQSADDTGLAQPTGGGYWQRSWNRANRIAREFGVQVDFIGVFAGADTAASSNWTDVNAGYHLQDWKKGYHDVWEKGYHWKYERNRNVILERASGMKYDKLVGTTWVQEPSSANYLLFNTNNDESDGWRVRTPSGSASSWSWSTSLLTQTQYQASNTTADITDGFRTSVNGSLSSTWDTVLQPEYDGSNTLSNSNDGWRATKVYSTPFDLWEGSTQSAYISGNAGWRTYRSYTSTFSAWEVTTEAEYIAGKTAGTDPTNGADGWTATKVYVPPYTSYDAMRTFSRTNREILGQLIDPSGLVDPIKDAGGNVINAEVANMYSSSNWADVKGALKAIALGQCGGTLTLQTRVNGAPAGDTFTYTNSLDNTKVDTSGAYRSGTFDFAIPSGGSVNPEIRQANVNTLIHYTPANWSCKAAGLTVTPTTVDVPGTPWDTIQINIPANAAVSCIQNVTWVP